MFNYLVYRVFDYFQGKENDKAIARTVNFLVFLEGSLVVPFFMILNNIEQHSGHLFTDDNRIEYFIGIPLFELIILAHSIIIKKRLQGLRLGIMKSKYAKAKYRLPLWVIFVAPIFFIFIFPVVFNGSASF